MQQAPYNDEIKASAASNKVKKCYQQ